MPGPAEETMAETGGTIDSGHLLIAVQRIFFALRNHILVATLTALSIIIPMVCYVCSAVPEYVSRGTLQVSDANAVIGTGPISELLGAGGQTEVQTEIEILRSNSIILRSLHSLKLQIQDPEEAYLLSLNPSISLFGQSPTTEQTSRVRDSIFSVAFTDSVRKHARVALQVADSEIILTDEEGASVQGPPGTPLQCAGVTLVFDRLPLNDGDNAAFDFVPDGLLLEQFRKEITISSLGTLREPTSIVEVRSKWRDRYIATRLTQALMDSYLETSLQWQSKSANQTAKFIQQQIEEISTRLRTDEDRLEAYLKENDAVELTTQAEVKIKKTAELEAHKFALELKERTLSSALSVLRSKAASQNLNLSVSYYDDVVLQVAVQNLTETETKFKVLSANLAPNHPQLASMARGLKKHRQEVKKLLVDGRRNTRNQILQVDDELAENLSLLRELPEKTTELARLVRDVEVAQRLYSLLLEKHEEAVIMRAATISNRRIIDPAMVPYDSFAPKRGRLLLLAFVFAFLAAVGTALTLHSFEKTLRSVKSITERIPAPVYGTIPEKAAAPSQSANRISPLEVWSDRHNPISEAFRSLSVSVAMVPVAHRSRGRIVAVTSAQPAEGKSTVLSNLAVALAKSGNRVLLVDLDLRKPVQHRLWGVPRSPGLSDLLLERYQDRKTTPNLRVVSVQDTELSILPAGTRVPDSLATVTTSLFRETLEEWAESCDYLLIDCPPAFVAETPVLLSLSDFCLLVTRPGVVERANLQQAWLRLRQTKVQLGLVLNCVGERHTSYGYGAAGYYYNSVYDDQQSESGNGDSRTSGTET